MRSRRDPFARLSYVPVVYATAAATYTTQTDSTQVACSWCGRSARPRHPIYQVRIESDGGRNNVISGQFCSWSCAETFHDERIGR